MKNIVRSKITVFKLIFFAFLLFTSQVNADTAPSEAGDPWNVTDGQKVTGPFEYNTTGANDTVTFSGAVTFDNDIIFKSDTNETLTVNISGTETIFKPLLGTDVSPKYAHLIFEPPEDGAVVVNVLSDLTMTGSNIDISMVAGGDTTNYANTELTLTFRGKGQTKFVLSNGKTVSLRSMVESTDSPAPVLVPAVAAGFAGVSSYIAMDEQRADVIGRGKNKVVFQRENFPLGGVLDCEFQIGLNSFMTFISVNYTGLDSSTDPLHSDIPTNPDGSIESYAALAFDVSNYDSGRMILNIAGNSADNTFTDGALNVSGLFLQSTDSYDEGSAVPTDGVPSDYVTNDHIRQFVNFSQVAGCQAFLRVIDERAYDNDTEYQAALNPGESGEVGVLTSGAYTGRYTRRGLLVKNSCRSHTYYASNFFGDSGWYYEEIFASGRGNSAIKHGFVLGVNGQIDVMHNTFLEYEASSANINFEPANIGLVTLDTLLTSAGIVDPGTLFKQHNPSAMIIDGLGPVLIDLGGGVFQDQIKFLAHIDQDIVRRAEIKLNGNASLTWRAPLLGSAGTYNGLRLPATGETLGDGVHVLDVQGLLTARSVDDDFVPEGSVEDPQGRHAGSSYAKEGTLRLGTLWRDYTDREVLDSLEVDPTSYVTRPLTIGSDYTRYDRGSIVSNASIDFIDLDFRHDDVSRDIRPDVNVSPPVLMGGERATFFSDVFAITNPDILFWRLINSKVHCHESMCISGVRVVVRELPEFQSLLTTPADEQNLSSIVMYNHGNTLDTNLKGFSRVFLMGSQLNEVANGGTSSFMSSAFMNIFRHTGGIDTGGSDAVNLPVKLSLETASELPVGAGADEKGTQMFYLGNESNVEVGWSTTLGGKKDSDGVIIYPFDHLPQATIDALISSDKFILDSDIETPATLSFAGDFIYLGGAGPNGELPPTRVNQFGLGRVIYMGHGSKIEITEDLTVPESPRPYIGFSDATIAIRVWKLEAPGLNTQISLPYDQFFLKNPIRPYDIDMSLLTDTGDNPYLRLSAITGNSLGTQVSISWQDIINRPPLVFPTSGYPASWGRITRNSILSRTQITQPVIMPTTGLLQVSSGDYLDQLTVSGATLADPFVLYMTGDNDGVSQVREFASVDSSVPVPGEGDFARLFVDQGARVGLGSRDWSADSVNAWNLIGRNFVTVIPNGDSQIDVNSDLVCADSQPIIPTQNFGSTYTTTGGETVNPEHRVTFFSHDTREVRVPAGFELDLSAFGKQTTTGFATQQIAFGGNIRLIFEPGSTLRFPDLTGSDVDNVPVLYMNENSQIVFEPIQDMENKFANYNDTDGDIVLRFDKLRDTDRLRTRIVGVGQIWINKTAEMIINDNALVAIECDDTTPHTDITISLQREGRLLLGDENILGGSLQVGNPLYNPDDTAFTITSAPDPEINFAIRLNDENTLVNIGRNGFMGFGVGVVDRFESRVNRWTLQKLQHVKNINIRNIVGTFSHNQIFDGSERESSLMAIGPITGGTYKFEFGANEKTIFRGGGNILYAGDITLSSPTEVIGQPSSATSYPDLGIASTAAALTFSDSDDNGKYSIVSSTENLKQVVGFATISPGTVVGTGITFTESSLNGGFGFEGSQSDAYQYLAFQNIKEQAPSKFVTLNNRSSESRIGYVNDTVIVRDNNLSLENGISFVDVQQVSSGALKSATVDSLGNPSSNTLPSN